MELLKLSTAAMLRVNVALPFNVRDQHGKLLIAQGKVIDQQQLGLLLERGVFVDREEYKAAAAAMARAGASRRVVEEQPRNQPTAFDLWEQAIWKLERLLKSMTSEPDFTGRMDAFAAQFISLVDRDPDIAIYVSMRQDERRMQLYSLMHALHTALVCRLMARRLEWPEERQLTLVKAALTMNAAMVELQGKLAVQERPLTDEQRAQVRAHPEQGVELLRAGGVTDAAWLEAVRDHHERRDGTGYPRGVTEMSELATALRLADVFMAKISPRVRRAPLAIQDAAKQMFQESQGSPIAAAIIKEYGVYPPGDFVKLASGETAIVIRRGEAANTPLVAAVTDRSGIVTLQVNRRNTAQAEFAITAPVRADKRPSLPVSPEKLFGLG